MMFEVVRMLFFQYMQDYTYEKCHGSNHNHHCNHDQCWYLQDKACAVVFNQYRHKVNACNDQ